MSKLNDSTLKIFKKYRLNTDMSVFGDENKLYDVVKVMDDMVGNQVGKYIGRLPFWDSAKPKTSTRYYYIRSDVERNYHRSTTDAPNVNTKPDFEYCYCFDPLSLKLIQNNAKFSDKFLLGFCYNNSFETVCYLGLIANGDKFEYALFEDVDMNIELTSETLPDGFSTSLFTFVSDKPWNVYLSNKSLDYFTSNSLYSILYIPTTTFAPIYIPSFITKSYYTTQSLTTSYFNAFSQVVKGEII